MTIAAPELVVDKTGPATMNLGEWGDFAIDFANAGLSDAWDVSIRDLLPVGLQGGMCELTPEILSAQVFAADGVTPCRQAAEPGSVTELQRQPSCQHVDAAPPASSARASG
jgi:uncharacterized repeat protein (TIGR01451 family)